MTTRELTTFIQEYVRHHDTCDAACRGDMFHGNHPTGKPCTCGLSDRLEDVLALATDSPWP